jgi:SAM-dependent methyltransferase
MSDDPSARWGDYFRETQHREPSKLLKEAIAYVSHRGRALDLGAGALVDSRYLIEQGFEVTAVDSSAEAAVYAEGLGERFNLVTIRFDVYDFPVSAFDVVNARYALPFNPPETFNGMFERLKASLAPGGVLVGDFFGPEDSWAERKHMTFHTKANLEQLLTPLEILRFEEEKKAGTTALGKEKFWHAFHVAARQV